MRTLFLSWQDSAASRAWFPIGRLDVGPDADRYVFRYTKGAAQAQHDAGFQPLLAFPKLDDVYESAELFPLFKNRVLDPQRQDFAEYLRWLDLSPDHADPIEILSVAGGERQTDSFEVFPKVVKAEDGTFRCRFFLHGLRHVSAAAQARVAWLKPGDPLQVCLELNNPATMGAIQLQTADYHILGWTPRYLVMDIVKALTEAPHVDASVIRINEAPAPLSKRLLIELRGRFSLAYEPMSGGQFEPIRQLQ